MRATPARPAGGAATAPPRSGKDTATAPARSRHRPLFDCFLDVGAPRTTDPGLRLNPKAVLQRAGSPPPAVSRHAPHRGRLRPGYPIAWVEQTQTAVLAPFWIMHGWARAVMALFDGSLAPDDLDERLRAALLAARVLLRPGEEPEAAVWIDGPRRELASQGWTLLEQPLPDAQLRALRRYCRALVDGRQLRFGDSQCPERAVAHNEGVARFWHHQLTGLITRLAGEALKPSYSYLASYGPGASLPAHLDREQCEITVSLLVDFEPEPDRASPWPLIVEGEEGDVPIYQAIGDAVVLRGRQLRHRRDRFDDGLRSTSIFFHFVPAGFTGPLQ
ncbi:MAG TPA: hypothetical protein VG388_13050 [Solirubrobacteraceae bacterium]|nr:hypothetical protein [Solirubrobacteraceae bacterium]